MDDYLRKGQVINRLSEQQVYALLLQRDFPKLLNLCEKDKRAWRILWAALYNADEQLRWPAIEAVAKMMSRLWQAGQEERVREYIRRLMWSLSDESGEMGWSSPQTVAETLCSIPELLEPYGSMMIYRSLEEPTLVAGGLWGIGRLGIRIKGAVVSLRQIVLGVFEIEDMKILGLAAWAMGEVGLGTALPYLEELKSHKAPVEIYINGRFYQKPIGQWAQEAIGKINMPMTTA
ncbi:DVU0298 family protein [Chloroflexota bacterium]